MKTTIDKAGRVVIPKKIRDAVGLEPGMEVDVRMCDGRVEIEPAAVPVKLVRRPGGMLVAVPEIPVDPLPHEVVEHMLDELWSGRGRIEEPGLDARVPDGPEEHRVEVVHRAERGVGEGLLRLQEVLGAVGEPLDLDAEAVRLRGGRSGSPVRRAGCRSRSARWCSAGSRPRSAGSWRAPSHRSRSRPGRPVRRPT